MAKGPGGPRIGRKQVLILPAGDYTKAKGTRPRKQGDRGKGDYERPLRVGAYRSRPPAIFGSFHRWKEHSRPQSKKCYFSANSP